MEYTTITIRDSFSAHLPAALVVKSGDGAIALDGVTVDALRRIARMFNRAADHLEDRNLDPMAADGASAFSLRYEFEWTPETFPWPADRVDED